MTEYDLIEQCKRQNHRAQQQLYEKLSPKMFGVCKRYMKTREDAEDVLVAGFYKVFSKLDSFKHKGSFEGWVRRVIVNEALMALRKRNNFNMTVEINNNLDVKDEINAQDNLEAQDILNLLDKLPTGYRTVFNLYVMEGYKHREIGEILGISINTSKSQLILAKKKLRHLIMQNQCPEMG